MHWKKLQLRKYARIFVRGHYLFLVAQSFPRATLSENCSLLGTDNVRQMVTIVYICMKKNTQLDLIGWEKRSSSVTPVQECNARANHTS